jgi:hypothetical protein
MHQVGFGDCFLLTFGYDKALGDGRKERHVLIDFGSTRWAHDHKDDHLEVAQSIAKRSGGKLDAVVMTHRHKDHLSGFGHPQAGAAIAALDPSIVVRPWTEDPDAARDAEKPGDVGVNSHALADGLRAAQTFAFEVERAFAGAQGEHRAALEHLAADQVPNQDAVTRLNDMAKAAEHGGRYVYAGQRSGLEKVLPGVKIKVLGPPTVEQWPAVATQRADDAQYWLGRQGFLGHLLREAGAPHALANGAKGVERDPLDPGPARWLVERMRDQHLQSLLRLTRALDDAMNNTSVVLLFEAGHRRLLFPGDAQIENWSYALKSNDAMAKKLRQKIPEVDLYKVGHHGSRNATPRSLVDGWRGRQIKLTSMMSTLPGVHGKSKETAVPRDTLIGALAELGPLQRTDKLVGAAGFADLTASTANQQPFAVAG